MTEQQLITNIKQALLALKVPSDIIKSLTKAELLACLKAD